MRIGLNHSVQCAWCDTCFLAEPTKKENEDYWHLNAACVSCQEKNKELEEYRFIPPPSEEVL